MAELVDALDSGSSGSNIVQVQVLLSAPLFKISPRNGGFFNTDFAHDAFYDDFFVIFHECSVQFLYIERLWYL